METDMIPSNNNFDNLKIIGNFLNKVLLNIDFIEVAYEFNQTMRDNQTGLFINFKKKINKKDIQSYKKTITDTLNTLNLKDIEITTSDRWYPNKILIHIGSMKFNFNDIKSQPYKEYIDYCKSLKTIIR